MWPAARRRCAKPADYDVTGVVAFFGEPILGGGMAEVRRRALNKFRGRYTWLIAAAALVVGGLVLPQLPFLFSLLAGSPRLCNLIGLAVPGIGLALAAGTLVARLRL